MIRDNDKKYLKNYPELIPVDIDIYRSSAGDKEIDSLKRVAQNLEGKHWANVSSTYEGGGVAEMLRSVIPILRGLDVKSSWYCIEGHDDFFSITKRFHNVIQGHKQDFSVKDLLETYIEVNKKNFKNREISADMTIVHDPQPCASIVHGSYESKMIWRCHIDTTEADQMIWHFLLPYINNYDGAVFTHKNFVKPGIKIPVYQVTPAIDPIAPKNLDRTTQEAKERLNKLFTEHNIDADRPLILAVSRYDIHKNQKTIIEAFKQLKSIHHIKKLNPMMIIVGNSATDDPEGMEMYKDILKVIDDDKDIYALLNIPDNDEHIGALMKLAKMFIHISTKEGFGLVVTEAMWQGTPVIGSNIGGITLQIINGRTGYLVSPYDIDRITSYMRHLLTDNDEREKIGLYAKEYVRQNFLITTLVKKYLILMRFLLGIDFPYFTITN